MSLFFDEDVAMKILQDDVWKRRGMSLLWGGETLSALAQPLSVVSIRQFFALGRQLARRPAQQ